jgi:hypothetical protein
MDFFDKAALWGRKYQRQLSAETGEALFSLSELLLRYDRNAILELSPIVDGQTVATYKPDAVRKLKVSLLDEGISSLGDKAGEWYEVYETAPSGDFARARIVSLIKYTPAAEIRLLIAQRNPDLYFKEDPIFAAIAARGDR